MVDILGDYLGVVGVEEVQLNFWSEDFLMRQAVLGIFRFYGSGSPVSTKVSVFFHGYGGLMVIEVPWIVPPEIVPPEIVPPEIVPPEIVPPEIVPPEIVPPEIVPRRLCPMRVSLLLLDELEFLQPVGLGGPELPVQGCPGRR